MAGPSKNRKPKPLARDPQKERKFKELAEKLTTQGLQVRREKLKQGFGFKVVSGSCLLKGQKILFIDQRMSQDDQLAFLTQYLISQGPEMVPELNADAAV